MPRPWGRSGGGIVHRRQTEQHLGPDSLIVLHHAANVRDVTAVNGELREVAEGSRLGVVRLQHFKGRVQPQPGVRAKGTEVRPFRFPGQFLYADFFRRLAPVLRGGLRHYPEPAEPVEAPGLASCMIFSWSFSMP